jgi:acyl dehydratase
LALYTVPSLDDSFAGVSSLNVTTSPHTVLGQQTVVAGVDRSGFRTDALGVAVPSGPYRVASASTIAYALATNDPISAHRSGVLAPPVFAVVPIFASLNAALLAVAPERLLGRLVHGEQEFRFIRPIMPGETLTGTCVPIGVHRRRSGTAVTIQAQVVDAAGAPVNNQWMTAFFRADGGADELGTDGEVGVAAPPHRFPEEIRPQQPVAWVTQHVEADQAIRYAAASGDQNPIHLDDALAKTVGLPGAILHGLCTMAFNSHALIGSLAAGDPRTLRRLAVRFSRPVLPGQDITTRVWRVRRAGRAVCYAYESTDASGDLVIKDGWAELGPA